MGESGGHVVYVHERDVEGGTGGSHDHIVNIENIMEKGGHHTS